MHGFKEEKEEDLFGEQLVKRLNVQRQRRQTCGACPPDKPNKRGERCERFNPPLLRGVALAETEQISRAPSRKNGFTKGATNKRTSALIEHSQSNEHILSVNTIPQQTAMKGHCERANESSNMKQYSQLKVVFQMAKNDIAGNQYAGLTELLREVKAPDFVTGDGIYRHSDSKSDFIGIIHDETVNITVDKKLIIYAKLQIKGKVETCFLGNYDVHSGTAQCIFDKVDEVLRERDVKLSRVIGLGSDGASVMMGKRAGVGALLKRESAFCIQVHCVAHRAALAALDAAKAVDQVGVYKRTVSSVYSFYKHSASRTNRLRQLTAALGDEDVKSLKQQCAVRWLSLHRAVEGIKLNWPALVIELHEEAVGGNAQAKGILGQIQQYCFIAWTHALADVLPVMTKLNLVFQKEDVNLATIPPMVHASVAALTQLRDAPGPEEERFQADCQNGMYRDVNVTHADDRSRQAFSNVRVRYITHLRFKYMLNQPSEPLLVILAKGLPARMTQCKPVPLSLMPQARTEMPSLAPRIRRHFLTACEVLIRDFGKIYPEWATLAKIACVIPVSSVPAERGFSLQRDLMPSKHPEDDVLLQRANKQITDLKEDIRRLSDELKEKESRVRSVGSFHLSTAFRLLTPSHQQSWSEVVRRSFLNGVTSPPRLGLRNRFTALSDNPVHPVDAPAALTRPDDPARPAGAPAALARPDDLARPADAPVAPTRPDLHPAASATSAPAADSICAASQATVESTRRPSSRPGPPLHVVDSSKRPRQGNPLRAQLFLLGHHILNTGTPRPLFAPTTLIIGDSIIRNIRFFNAATRCLPGATVP
ncbi:hypothetical protein F7725_017660, partial [Dissostichus mawsoni]